MSEHQGHEEQGGGEGGKPRLPGACMSGDTAEILRAWEPQSSTDSSFRKLPFQLEGGGWMDGKGRNPGIWAWCLQEP